MNPFRDYDKTIQFADADKQDDAAKLRSFTSEVEKVFMLVRPFLDLKLRAGTADQRTTVIQAYSVVVACVDFGSETDNASIETINMAELEKASHELCVATAACGVEALRVDYMVRVIRLAKKCVEVSACVCAGAT